MVADEDDYRSLSEDVHYQVDDDDDDEDELTMNPSRDHQIYGYSIPSPQSRQKRPGNAPQQLDDASPIKRRRVSDTGRPKALVKRK